MLLRLHHYHVGRTPHPPRPEAYVKDAGMEGLFEVPHKGWTPAFSGIFNVMMSYDMDGIIYGLLICMVYVNIWY